MKKYIKNTQGMTLMEAVVGLAIFAIFTMLVNTIFLNVLRSISKEEALKEVKQNGERAMQIMTSEIRSATSVDIGSCSTSLIFSRSDGEDIIYREDTNRLVKDFVSSPPDDENMTGTLITVEDLQFTCSRLNSGEVQVDIDLTLEHARIIEGRGDTSAETVFHSTVVTR